MTGEHATIGAVLRIAIRRKRPPTAGAFAIALQAARLNRDDDGQYPLHRDLSVSAVGEIESGVSRNERSYGQTMFEVAPGKHPTARIREKNAHHCKT
jgi:hypothetical protein